MNERTLVRDLSAKSGQAVLVIGWLHKMRKLGGLNFIVVRDRSGLVQVLVQDETEAEKLRGLQIGTVVSVEGQVVSDERAPGGVELHEPKINVDVPVKDVPPVEIDKSVDHKPENYDTLFEYRVVSLRNAKETSIFKIRASLQKALRQYFDEQDFTEINTPKLIAEATEGGAQVFKTDYFGKEAFLAQSPQFYKEMLVGVFERVYEIAPVYRAEPSATTRHMTEYLSVDAEMGFINLEDLKSFLSGLLNHTINTVWQHHESELKRLNAVKPIVPEMIPSMPLNEIHEKYSAETNENTVGEKDLRPDEERWVCEYAKKNLNSEAVFVTDWPASDMKFYHKAQSENQGLADRIDLIFRGVEIVTGSMREHRYDVLLEQLKKAGGNPDDPGYKYFLMAMRYGMPPLGGFGLGAERLTQTLLGLHSVKEATLFPRDINRLAP